MISSSFQDRCLSLGVAIHNLLASAPRSPASNDIVDQLMRSGASIGANVSEAQGAESRADLIHKMGISLKEARESLYWLTFLERAQLVKSPIIPELKAECHELISILVTSIKTAKQNILLE